MKKDNKPEKSPLLSKWERYIISQKDTLTPTSLKNQQLSIKRFQHFIQKEKISPTELTPELLSKYVDYLTCLGLSNNSTHEHLKKLRFLNKSDQVGQMPY